MLSGKERVGADDGGLILEKGDEGESGTLQRVFNPTVAQSKVATGRLDGHKVQEQSQCDTKSDH